MKTVSRRTVFAALAAVHLSVLFAVPGTSALAQMQNRVLVGVPPGGAQNAMAHLFAEKLSEATGRRFVAEAKTGAAGQLAAEALKAAAPDGSTLLMTGHSNISLYPHTTRKPAYNPLTDFVAVAHTGDYRLALAVTPSVPANDLATFVKWTKSQQPKVTGYGTAGAGTSLHFYGILLAQATGAAITHVPYRGAGPVLVDMMAGHVPAAVLPLGTFVPHARAGKVRVLGQSGDGRSPTMPDVPTFKELGFPMLVASGWFGMFAPAGTRPEIVGRYNEVIGQALRTQEVQDRLRSFDLEFREMSVQEFGAMVRADSERWAPVIRASGFSASSD